MAAADKATHQTLVAATVDTVNLAVQVDEVEIVSRDGAAEIYYTVDGSTPMVGGANCFVLPAGIGSQTVGVSAKGNTVVKLISAGTPAYSVCRTS